MANQLNNAIANIGNKLPTDAIDLVKELPEGLWNPYGGDAFVLGGLTLLQRLATTDGMGFYDEAQRIDNSKFIEYILSNRPPKNEEEKEICAKACVLSAIKGGVFEDSVLHSSYSGSENVFLTLWSHTKDFLSQSDQFKIASEVFAKRNPIWSNAAQIVAKEATCDWNTRGYSKSLTVPTYVSGNRFFPHKVTPLYWVQEKSVFEILVNRGASLEVDVDGKPLHELIQSRPVDSFNGAQERRALLSWLDKTLGQKDTQSTAWEKVRMCRQSSDIDRLLKDTKKEWPTWRGELGENLVQHIAMFQPQHLWKILKRSDCGFPEFEHKDNTGRGLSTWLGLGIAMYEGRDNSIKIEEKLKGTKFEDAKLSPTKDPVDLAVLGLSVLDLSKELYWGGSQVLRIGGYNKEQPVVWTTKWVEGGEVCKFFGQRYAISGLTNEINNLVAETAAKEVKNNTELGQRLFKNSILNTTSDWVINNIQLYARAKTEDDARANLWSVKLEHMVAKSVSNDKDQPLLTEYVFHNIIQSSYNNRRYFAAPKKDVLAVTPFDLKKVFTASMNPEEIMGKYEKVQDVKDNVLSMGWERLVSMPWQHCVLQERVGSELTKNKSSLSAL